MPAVPPAVVATTAEEIFIELLDNFFLRGGSDGNIDGGLGGGSPLTLEQIGALLALAPTYTDNAAALADGYPVGKPYLTPTGGVTITQTVATPTGNVYWGERAEGSAALTNSQIKATTPHPYVPGADITATFSNIGPRILWIAFPSTETGIAFYFINNSDKGLLSNSVFTQSTVGDLTVLTSIYGTQFGTDTAPVADVQLRHTSVV